jgi:glycosyltransferase involved in cell wall biosynthesis
LEYGGKQVTKLFLVVPCYNEEEVLPITAQQLQAKMTELIEKNAISPDSKVVFVNDGSKDKTWEIIKSLHTENPLFQGINLARNRGHQNALLAGLMTVRDFCDVTISLDADLQDDINAISDMLAEFQKGAEIVYGVRSKRKKDTFFKRATAEGFYKVLKVLGAEIVFNHADYRLMSRRALDGLSEFQEVNLFLRGIVPMIGYKTASVYFERLERVAGETKYPLKKMLALAFEGITSLTIRPIRAISTLGVTVLLAFLALLVLCLYIGITWEHAIILTVLLIGGLNILCIGIVGEYVGKIYLETKHRPRYIVQEFTLVASEMSSPLEPCLK